MKPKAASMRKINKIYKPLPILTRKKERKYKLIISILRAVTSLQRSTNIKRINRECYPFNFFPINLTTNMK